MMSTLRLSTVFEYLATLIGEREAEEPLMLSQLQLAITYKFPDFTFAAYELAGLKDFILAGEKAGYFKLVNTGNMQTAYLATGNKRPQVRPATSTMLIETSEMGANDPRRTRWMTLTLENMLSADRADQVADAIQDVDALSDEFDAFLVAEIKAAPMYPVRGKLKRLREFVATCRTKGEAQAEASWQISRTTLRMPSTPPIEGAGRAQSLIWALLQGSTTLEATPIESLDTFFFAVLNFSREQMARNKSWDWVIGLDMLEVEARALPRPVASMKRVTLLGGKPPTGPINPIDNAAIAALTEQLRQAAGVEAAHKDDIPTWQAYVQTPSLDVMLRFLAEHPRLAEDDRLMAWLEDQISQNTAAGTMDAVRNLANKAALLIAVRQLGLDGVRKNPGELKNIYESVMEGARQLGLVFKFLDAPGTAEAVQMFEQNADLADENIGPLFEDQMMKAADNNDLDYYRTVSERLDLWRNLLDFGSAEGVRHHERFATAGRDDRVIQAEMGLLLLVQATSADERQDIIGRYPAVATEDGLALANRTLESLSFHNADATLYNQHYNVKRLIERCLELGIDRALAELK